MKIFKSNTRITETKLETLRKQAVDLLDSGEEFVANFSVKDSIDLHELIEEHRIYQAELEIQNEELQAVNIEKQAYREHYERIYNSVPMPIVLLSAKGVILDNNTYASRNLHMSLVSSAYKNSFYKLIDQDSCLALNRALISLADVKQHGVRSTLEFLINTLSPNNKTYAATLLPFYSVLESPEPRYMLILHDLTSEQELALERRLFESIIDQKDEILFVVAPDLSILCNNLNAIRILEAPQQHGVCWDDVCRVFPKTIPDLITSLLAEEYPPGQKSEPLHRFSTCLDDSGTTREYSAKLFHTVIDEIGTFGVGVEINDETERLQQDDELRVALSIFDLTSQAIMVIDTEHKITYVNNAYEIISGYKYKEVIGTISNIFSSRLNQAEFYNDLWSDFYANRFWSGKIWNTNKRGKKYLQALNLSPYPKEGDIQKYIVTFTDITSEDASQQQIHALAFYDPLTSAGNRRLLEKTINNIVEHHSDVESFCLMYLDLDRFKDVNDNYGHGVGDTLLTLVVQRLMGALRNKDDIFRIGGDEFVILINDIQAQKVAEKARQVVNILQVPFILNNKEIRTSCSIGIVSYPNDGTDFASLLKHADIAMYEAKRNGKNGFHFFDPALVALIERRLQIEQVLHSSLATGRQLMVYQPQFCIAENQLYGYEALLRIPNLDNHIECSTTECVEVAEKTGMITQVTLFAIQDIIKTIIHLRENNRLNYLRMSVNLSAIDFMREEQFNEIIALLRVHPEEAQSIDFEITESIIMDEPDTKIVQLSKSKRFGAKIVIDDFGTGYSSLAYLAQFDVDILKIDKTFVHNIGKDKRSESICISVINLANALEIKCLAEGVETQEQLDFLAKHKCELMQGYLTGMPEALP